MRDGHTSACSPSTRGRRAVAPFKGGSFQSAVAAGVDVLPAPIAGAGEVLPPEGFRVRAGVITVRFGAALATTEASGATGRQALADAAHASVLALLRRSA